MAGLRRIGPDIPVQFVTAPGDQALAAVAERQYGVIAHAQLRALGLSKSTIGDRVRAGRLHPVHRGVYAVGHGVLGIRGRWLAAVLACGPTAVLSHASAAALWELRGTAAAKIDVTVRTAGGRSRPALRIHRPRTLHDEELTTRHGIPVTTPARTLLDLAATLTRRRLERALDQAEVLELLDARSLDAVARAHPNHHGTTSLSAALQAHHPGTTLTRSELEEAMLALCRAHDLPGPAVNAHAAGLEVDFLFPTDHLVVETDGWRYHRTRRAFENDRRRDATLARAGYRVLRFTHHQVERDAAAVAETIAAALRGQRAAVPPR
jgi:very-short-patch-repair endonuclease